MIYSRLCKLNVQVFMYADFLFIVVTNLPNLFRKISENCKTDVIV